MTSSSSHKLFENGKVLIYPAYLAELQIISEELLFHRIT